MLRHCDRIAFLALPAFLLLLLILGIAAPPSAQPGTPPPPPRERPVVVEIIREKIKHPPTPKVEPPKPKPPKPIEQTPEPPKPEPVETPSRKKTVAKGETEDGTLPPLKADYRKRVGFRRYAEAMQRAGADFFVTGAKPGTLLQIDLGSNDLIEVVISRLAARGYSPRTRIISDEPELKTVLKRAADIYNVPSPHVLMLVPAQMETDISQVLQSELAPKDIELSDVTSLQGEYYLTGSRLNLLISRIHVDGKIIPVQIDVSIQQL